MRWVCGAIAIVGLAVLVACGIPVSEEVATASPSQRSSGSSALPTPSAGASVSPPDGTPTPSNSSLSSDTIAEVVTSDLVVRSAPGVDLPSEILPDLLQEGDLLFVIEGPVHATFYDWYYVQPIADPPWPSAGWVAAASRDGEAWIAPGGLNCPHDEEFEAAELAAYHALEALACFDDRTLRVRAMSLICSGYIPGDPEDPLIPNFTIEPAWLGLGGGCAMNTAEGSVYGASQPFFTPEVGGPPGAAPWLWLTGQFDHPASQSCTLEHQTGHPSMPPAPDLDSTEVVLLCRSRFAVAAIEQADEPDE